LISFLAWQQTPGTPFHYAEPELKALVVSGFNIESGEIALLCRFS
jgi:hypothetical protein